MTKKTRSLRGFTLLALLMLPGAGIGMAAPGTSGHPYGWDGYGTGAGVVRYVVHTARAVCGREPVAKSATVCNFLRGLERERGEQTAAVAGGGGIPGDIDTTSASASGGSVAPGSVHFPDGPVSGAIDASGSGTGSAGSVTIVAPPKK